MKSLFSKRFHDQAMTQKEAVSVCESEQEVPAHLIEVDSQEENQAIHNEDVRREKTCSGYKKTRYWMGIKKGPSGRDSDWVLESNGKSITFSNWLRLDWRNYACAVIQHTSGGAVWVSKGCGKSGNSAYTIYYTALCELD